MGSVSVIIPTSGLGTRKDSLDKAIDSILNQSYNDVFTIVVLNGTSYDESIYSKLSNDDKIQFRYIKKGSSPNAIYEGRKMVKSDYFAFLDDDDFYSSDSIEKKIAEFNRNPDIDVVVGNGNRSFETNSQKILMDIDELNNNPLKVLGKYNWLPSCSALFKTKTVTPSFFDPDIKYYEWTYLAYKLAMYTKIRFIDDITYYISDSDCSLSKSEQYLLYHPNLFNKLKSLDMPKSIHKNIMRKEVNCYHKISQHFLRIGNLKNAWKWHIKCLSKPYGWKFISYTRYLLK